MMYSICADELLFFDKALSALSIYESFAAKLYEAFPATRRTVQKTQITFSNRHVYACVSFTKVRKKAELPDAYFVLTLGLPCPLESCRVAAKTEPYPGRWTTHFVIASATELDEELFAWIRQAYAFADCK